MSSCGVLELFTTDAEKQAPDRFESDVEGVLHRASYWLMMTSGRTFLSWASMRASRAMTPLLANPLGGNYHRWSWRTLVRVYHIEWVGGHALYSRWKRISLCSNRLVPRAENDWVRTRLFSTRNWGGTLARVYSPLMCVAREATFSVVRALIRVICFRRLFSDALAYVIGIAIRLQFVDCRKHGSGRLLPTRCWDAFLTWKGYFGWRSTGVCFHEHVVRLTPCTWKHIHVRADPRNIAHTPDRVMVGRFDFQEARAPWNHAHEGKGTYTGFMSSKNPSFDSKVRYKKAQVWCNWRIYRLLSWLSCP